VDAFARACDPGKERGNELVLAAHQRVDGAVVVCIAVDVEQAGVCREHLCDRVDRRAVAPLGEVGDGLQRPHPTGPPRPAVTGRKSPYRSLGSLERALGRCRVCAEAGYPLESLPVRAPGAQQRAYLFGQAPGVVEGEERLPWRGRAGRALRRWLDLEEDE